MCFWHQNFPQFHEINIISIFKKLGHPKPLLLLILLVQGAEYFA
jgi:hypothetical protein